MTREVPVIFSGGGRVLNFLQCFGQSHKIKNYPAQNSNSIPGDTHYRQTRSSTISHTHPMFNLLSTYSYILFFNLNSPAQSYQNINQPSVISSQLDHYVMKEPFLGLTPPQLCLTKGHGSLCHFIHLCYFVFYYDHLFLIPH